MQITFLGTGAASAYPLAFCRCAYCEQARRLGGKNLRKRSAVLINDDLLIDLGPDIVAASFQYQKSIAAVRHCLQTHPHSDHFDAGHLTTRAPEYMGVDTPPLRLYGSRATLRKMSEMVADEGDVTGLLDSRDQQRLNLEVTAVQPGQAFAAGPYRVSAFWSNHDPSVESLVYAVADGEVSVFYGTDTDSLPEETWRGFHDLRLRFTLVILDHTYGPGTDGGGHLNAGRFIEHAGRMRSEGLLAENARILATHISHEGNPPHAELAEFAARHGYEIAYDGLVVQGSAGLRP